MKIFLYILCLLSRIECLIALNYRGISITWRRLISNESNRITIEFLITLSSSDKISHLCDNFQSKFDEIQSQFGFECLNSWNNCQSWSDHISNIECYSKSYDSPKSLIYNRLNLSISSKTFYEFRFPSKPSGYWSDLSNPIELNSYINLNEINSSPIARFPDYISINIYEDFYYSLEIFDPDGDEFDCISLSSILIDKKCFFQIPANTFKDEDEILIKIEIIEYKINEIRSRLPFHFLVYLNNDNRSEHCHQIPTIHFLNFENNFLHILLNETIQIDLISQSQCDIEIDQCLIQSQFHWKIKSLIETIIRNQIQIEFEWTPNLLEQCGYHIHCIRCIDQLDNFNEKCIQIFVYGSNCQYLINQKSICTWSTFTKWIKHNETSYKRNRTCYETLNSKKICSFCFGLSIQYQSSSSFIKDLELFQESLLTPTRAHSTMKIIFITTIFSNQ
ncbi:hypothetical protein I4U23_027685 [Adineta vaga]|nr:hypothetical protein I4U23_027685 [Adineta vaga]